MGHFNRDNNRFGGKRFGQREKFGERQMFKATCAECGNECEVPFKPVPGRAVFCSECFGKRGNKPEGSFRERPERPFQKPNFERNNNSSGNNTQILEQISQLNSKLDKILLALQPKDVKPEKTVKTTSVKKPKALAAKKTIKKKAKK